MFVIGIFMTGNWIGYFIIIAATVGMYAISRIPIKMVMKGIKPIIPIVVFTVILNLFFLDGDVVLLDWWIFRITDKGVEYAIMIIIRIVCLIAGTSLMTYTTRPMELTDAIEMLLSPLKKIKMPVHEFAMMMTIALRFIPTLIDETDKIMSAQKARGATLDNGNLIQRAKALVPILIPLFISAFRRADELATAMECRCYNGGEGRTKYKQLKFSNKDIIAAIVITIVIATIIFANFWVMI